MGILGVLSISVDGFDLIRSLTCVALLPQEVVVVVLYRALLHVFMRKVGSHEALCLFLRRDAPFALDGRRVEPLLGGPIGTVECEKTNPSHFRRSGKPDQDLAVSAIPLAPEEPALVQRLPLVVNHLNGAGIAVAFRQLAAFRFAHDFKGAIRGSRANETERQNQKG